MTLLFRRSLLAICSLALATASCGDDPDEESADAASVSDGAVAAVDAARADAAQPDAMAQSAFSIIQNYAETSDASALTLQELIDAEVTGALADNLALYKIAIAAAETITDLAQLQLFIDNVNGLAGAEVVGQGGGSAGIAIAANATYWISIDNSFANHQISATTIDNIDLQLDIFYPGYRGIEDANFSYNDQPQGAAASERHDTGATEVLPNGIVYFRITELSGNAGSFNFFDSD